MRPSTHEVIEVMKCYKVGGYVFQYEEGKQPEGAIEVKADKKPANKKAPAKKTKAAK